MMEAFALVCPILMAGGFIGFVLIGLLEVFP